MDDAGNGHMHNSTIAWTMKRVCGKTEMLVQAKVVTDRDNISKRVGSSSNRREAMPMTVQKRRGERVKCSSGEFFGSNMQKNGW